MPTTITAGQTPLLVSDFIARLTQSDANYLKAGVDFFQSFKITMPAYAASYSGEYFKVSKNSTDPTALPAPIATAATGKIYELPMPTDALDSGIMDLVLQNSNGVFPELSVTQQESENLWDITATTTAYWRHAGRKVRAYIPNAYTSSSPQYSTPYKRYPAIPTSSSDPIDGPAEDVLTLFNSWKGNIVRL